MLGARSGSDTRAIGGRGLLLLQQGTDNDKINAAHAAGQISADTRDHLHDLRKASNKGVHRHSPPFLPEDKVAVANATYMIATMTWADL